MIGYLQYMLQCLQRHNDLLRIKLTFQQPHIALYALRCFLLPSRLYCRFWILTKSCLAAHGLALLGYHRRSGIPLLRNPVNMILPEKGHPALKNTILFTVLFYSCLLHLSTGIFFKMSYFWLSSDTGIFFHNCQIFMVSWIRFFCKSTLITFTSTISPTLTASRGCLM